MLRVRSQLSRVNAPSSLSNPPNLRSSVPSPRLGREDFPQSGEELLKTQNHPVLIGTLKRIENRATRVESIRSHFSNRDRNREFRNAPFMVQPRPKRDRLFSQSGACVSDGKRSSRSLAAQSENRRIGAIQGGTPNKLEFLQPLSNQPDHTLQGGTKMRVFQCTIHGAVGPLFVRYSGATGGLSLPVFSPYHTRNKTSSRLKSTMVTAMATAAYTHDIPKIIAMYPQ